MIHDDSSPFDKAQGVPSTVEGRHRQENAFLVKRRSFGSRVTGFKFQVSSCPKTTSENVKLETCNLKHLNQIRFTLHERRFTHRRRFTPKSSESAITVDALMNEAG